MALNLCPNEDSNCKDKFEPGAARFGNFINYYSFNSSSKRLQALPIDLSSRIQLKEHSIFCLDVGCNSGDLTSAFYEYLVKTYTNCTKIFMLGIDMDEDLIKRCKETNKYPETITYEQINIMDESALNRLNMYLKTFSRINFDIVTCFSTTMWVHLNYGDSGLDKLLQILSNFARYLFIEPQEWKCYRSAVRRMTRLNREKFNIQELKIKSISSYIIQFLQDKNSMHLLSCCGETSWGRKLYMYEK